MTRSGFYLKCFRFFALAFVFPIAIQAQEKEKKDKPDQLNVFKVDLLQIGVNEVRFSYEMETGRSSSLEFGLGAIYRNAFWLQRGDRPLLANGGGVYFAFRKYMDKKKYFSEPKLRSYVSPMFFYRYSAYKNEWLSYNAGLGLKDCFLTSEKFHQAAFVLRFGWQTARGRFVLDFYSGLGFKFIPSTLTTHIGTLGTTSCQVTDESFAIRRDEKFYGTNVIINGGLKIGLRRNNKETNYKDEPAGDPDADPSSPPQF